VQNGVYLHHESGADSSGACTASASPTAAILMMVAGERRASTDSLCRVTYIIPKADSITVLPM